MPVIQASFHEQRFGAHTRALSFNTWPPPLGLRLSTYLCLCLFKFFQVTQRVQGPEMEGHLGLSCSTLFIVQWGKWRSKEGIQFA